MNDEELAKVANPPLVGHYDDWHDYAIDDGSIWFNPFSISDFGLEGSLEAYKAYVQKRPDLMALVPSLRGRNLACRCRHDTQISPACHGDSLVELYMSWARERITEDPDYFKEKN